MKPNVQQPPILLLAEILVDLLVDDYLTAQPAANKAEAEKRTERVALRDANKAA